ncbi:hypothetical protein BDR04DRAFT_1111609 [Suillus decipiens]|nr:hypothetical protein BDR04DRAFT_1111609 [Suillus decipiens]
MKNDVNCRWTEKLARKATTACCDEDITMGIIRQSRKMIKDLRARKKMGSEGRKSASQVRLMGGQS